MSAHLLVVEDDGEIAALLDTYLSGQGYRVTTVTSGAAMHATLEEMRAVNPVELVLLDLGLPGEDGLSLARHLREHWAVGIIIVTGRGETVDRVVGLEVGADDYVAKPFDLRELLARVRSVLRRVKPKSAPPSIPSTTNDRVRFAGWSLDLAARTLRSSAGREIALTTGEFDLLCAFVHHANRVLSRDQLMALIHNRDAGPFDRAIDVQVGRLRRKMETDPTQPALIKSIRGAGYMFIAKTEKG